MQNTFRSVAGNIVLLAVCAASPLKADDIDTLAARLQADYLTGSSSGASTYLADQQADGSWADIDYASRSRTAWPPVTHVNRIKRMAIAYGSTGNAQYHSAALLAGIVKGFEFWYTRKPVSDNWWYNDIGQQLEMGPALVAIQDSLPAAIVDTGCTYLNDPQTTGQNLVWYATQTVQRGCLKRLVADVNLGLGAISNEVRITTSEGIQPDYSFHQHGPQLYNGGYGSGFVSDVSYWMYMARGLGFAFTVEKVNVLSGLILDGTQWMVRRGNMDFACQGREISRPNNGRATAFNAALSRMALLGTGRQAEFEAFTSHIAGTNDSARTGVRMFYRTDYFVQRRAEYHLSVKMCSNRTNGTEYMNDENKKGYYLPFGATAIMRAGDEFYNIYPIWNWAHIPGVTCCHRTAIPAMTTYIRGTTDFVGGTVYERCGVAVMDLNWNTVRGNKAWFAFDEGVVALGAGIRSSDPVAVHTTINQCLMRGGVWAQVSSQPAASLTAGTHALDSCAWVWHDSVGYVFPGNADVVVRGDTQSGSWQSINSTYSSALVTDTVFCAWLDHGVSPAGLSYEYVILPGADRAETGNYASHPALRVVANDTAVQAVRNDASGLTGIVFHQAGEVAVHAGLSVRVDHPCVLAFDDLHGMGISAANPAQAALTVRVTLTFPTGPGDTMAFELPPDGRTITVGPGLAVGARAPARTDWRPSVKVLREGGNVVLRIGLRDSGPVAVQVLRPDGRVLARAAWDHPTRQCMIRMNEGHVSPGVYLVHFTVADVTYSLRVRM